jgi:hypothetical protein
MHRRSGPRAATVNRRTFHKPQTATMFENCGGSRRGQRSCSIVPTYPQERPPGHDKQTPTLPGTRGRGRAARGALADYRLFRIDGSLA